jgi:hypothetical protein
MTEADAQRRDTTVVVGLLTVITLAFAIAGLFTWSSNADWAEFLATATQSEASASTREPAGRTGCPRGNQQLPSQLPADPE